MKNFVKIQKLFKMAEENLSESEELKDWEAVKADASDRELSEEVLGVIANIEEIKKSDEIAKRVIQKTKEAKSYADSLPPEEKESLVGAVTDPEILSAANQYAGGKTSASALIDLFFVKTASKYVSKNEAIQIIREINLYKNLHGTNVKIASNDELKSAFFEKEAAFNEMISNDSFLSSSSFLKIANKYEKNINKSAESLWEETKKIISDNPFSSAGVATGLGILGSSRIWGGIKATFSFIWFKIMPFVGVYLATMEYLHSCKEIAKYLNLAKEMFSEFGKAEVIFDAEYIKNLIPYFKDNPKAMLRLNQLNEVATFYTQNYLTRIYSVIWFFADLITSLGIVIAAVFSGGVGGILGALGQRILKVAGYTAIATLLGNLSLSFLDIGVRDFLENTKEILKICDSKIAELTTNREEEPPPYDDSRGGPSSGPVAKSNIEDKRTNDEILKDLQLFEEFEKSMAS